MNLAPVKGSAPKGQESLAQGSPWVSQNKRFALKGLETRTRSGSKVRYLVAPSGLIRLGGITQGKPWAMLFWPLRATDWKHPNSLETHDAKHLPERFRGCGPLF